MKVSLISSLYKSDRYLPKFSSYLKNFAQELSGRGIEWEFIVVANDPTEAEKTFQREFAPFPWFKFVAVPRETLYATWNRGVAMATGDILGFWAVDDFRYPGSIEEALRLFKSGAELVYFPFYIKRYLKILGHYFLVHRQKIDKQVPEYNSGTRQDFMHSMHCGPFWLAGKKLFERVGPFDEQFKSSGDFDWCARAAKVSEHFVRGQALGGVFRVDGNGLSSGGNMRQVVENNIIYKRFGALNKLQPEDENIAKQYRVNELLYQGQFQPLK